MLMKQHLLNRLGGRNAEVATTTDDCGWLSNTCYPGKDDN
jgi:hypothetical protein